jgi:hypothetical protein
MNIILSRFLLGCGGPKYKAITQLNSQAKAPVTAGNVPPFTANGTENDAWFGMGYHKYGSGTLRMDVNSGLPVGATAYAYVAYAFRVTTAGNYTVNPALEITKGPLQIFCDGILVGTIPTGTAGPLATPIALAHLQPGLHVIVLKPVNMSLGITSVAFGIGQ